MVLAARWVTSSELTKPANKDCVTGSSIRVALGTLALRRYMLRAPLFI